MSNRTLNVNTPNGQVASYHEKRLLKHLKEQYPGAAFAHTPHDGPAFLDLVISNHRSIVAVAEIKTRNDPVQQMFAWGTYMISKSKIDQLAKMAPQLGVPGHLLVLFVPDDQFALCEVCDATGKFLIEFTEEMRRMKAGVNGGTKEELCAMIPMKFFRDAEPADFGQSEK